MRSLAYYVNLGLVLVMVSACSNEEFVYTLNEFDQTFSQLAEEKKVDILMVVDNSISMIHDQSKLSREFNNFVSALQDANYRIGVITTDTDSIGKENEPGYYGNLDHIGDSDTLFIDKSSSDPSLLFSEAINREETRTCLENQQHFNCVSPNEMPLRALKRALDKRFSVNSDFFREDAELAIVIITDEDETANAEGETYSAVEFLNYFNREFGDTKLLTAFTIAIPEGDEDCLQAQRAETFTGKAGEYGKRVGALADLTEGFQANICNENFGEDLVKISEFVEKTLLVTRIKLPGDPRRDSIQLEVTTPEGELFDANWELKNGFIEVYPTPPEGSAIRLSFDY